MLPELYPVFHNLVFVSIPDLPYASLQIRHGLCGMGQIMFTNTSCWWDDDVELHDTTEIFFRLRVKT